MKFYFNNILNKKLFEVPNSVQKYDVKYRSKSFICSCFFR